eukprot:286842-Pleurochrysis_carterae.AAC.4
MVSRHSATCSGQHEYVLETRLKTCSGQSEHVLGFVRRHSKGESEDFTAQAHGLLTLDPSEKVVELPYASPRACATTFQQPMRNDLPATHVQRVLFGPICLAAYQTR